MFTWLLLVYITKEIILCLHLASFRISFFFLVLTPTRTAYWNLRIVGRGCIFKVVVNFFFNHLRYLSFDKKLMILEGSIVLIFFFYIHSERRWSRSFTTSYLLFIFLLSIPVHVLLLFTQAHLVLFVISLWYDCFQCRVCKIHSAQFPHYMFSEFQLYLFLS